MNYAPLNYNQINLSAGRFSPSSVKNHNNLSFWFWARSLFQRCQSVIDLQVPDSWDGKTKDFLYYCLFKYGFVAVFERPEYGITFQPCTLNGYDWYYQPAEAIVTNPALTQSLTMKIGKECQLIKLTPDYYGTWDIIDYYAEKLSMMDIAINSSIVNSKFAYILGAKNKSGAQAIKKVLDLINKGEPAVIYDSRIFDDVNSKESTPFQTWLRENMKQNYITSDLLSDFQTIINQFDREIGIPTIPYEKKERLVESEADSTQIDAKARSTTWINTLTSSIEEVKQLFPDLKLSASLRYEVAEKGEDANEQRENDADRR